MKKADTLRVLGIDPGSHVTGYGIVEYAASGLKCVLHGEIKPVRGAGASLSGCLQTICGGIQEAIRDAGSAPRGNAEPARLGSRGRKGRCCSS